jgi:hypothetical protein
MSDLGKKRILLVLLAGACGLGRWLLAEDCNCNGFDDASDIAQRTSRDCNGNGVPDECELGPQVRFTPAAVIEQRWGRTVGALAILDLDGDSRPDLAAGSHGWNAGRVTLLSNGGGRALRDGMDIRLASEVRSLAAGDLDGDGAADLAACIPFAAAVLFSDKEGGIRERRDIPVHSDPVAIAAGDIDGDGDIDLVTANALAGNRLEDNVSVLRNLGGGILRLEANYAAGRSPAAIVLDDLDGDGRLDIALVSAGNPEVTILRNLGGGVFAPREAVKLGRQALASGDFDGDGAIDLVVGGSSIEVLLNAGDGSFASRRELGAALAPSTIAACDFDGDGDLDIAAGPFGVGLVSNLGEARFGPALMLAPECHHVKVLAAADLDGDGAVDLALGGSGAFDVSVFNSGLVELLWNDARRGFDAPQRLVPRTYPQFVAAVDLDLDGDQDLVFPGQELSTYHNDGRARFEEHRISFWSNGPVVIADLDTDGRPDLAAVHQGMVWILWSEAAGSFASRMDLPIDELEITSLAAADLDGDGEIDLAGIHARARVLRIHRNAGRRRFTPAASLPVSGDAGRLLAADLDGDGREDLAAVEGSSPSAAIAIRWNNGSLAFEAAEPLAARERPMTLKAADFDGDGAGDVVAFHSSGTAGGSRISIFRHLGGRRFASLETRRFGDDSPMELADLDGDGSLDLLVAGGRSPWEPSVLTLLTRDGQGVFQAARRFNGAIGRSLMATAADLDADGAVDLAWMVQEVSTIPHLRIILDPLREVRGRSRYVLGDHAERALALDFDGDGRVDLATANAREGTIALQRGLGAFEYEEARFLFAAESPAALAGADLDGDGRSELICADRGGEVLCLEAGGASKHRLPVPGSPHLLETADLDADGDLDLIVVSSVGEQGPADLLAFLWNAGDGALEPARVLPLEPATRPTALVAADLDGDGLLDLGFTGRETAPHWLRNAGAGLFSTARSFGLGVGYSALAAADLDGDGAPDILLGNSLHVLELGNRGGRFELRRELRGRGAEVIDVRDLDGNGSPDLLFFSCLQSSPCRGWFDLFVRLQERGDELPRCAAASVGPYTPPADLDGDGHLDLIRLGRLDLAILAGRTSPPAATDRNRNGVLDACEEPRFHRGDATGDGRVDLSDAVRLLGHLFLAQAAPACRDAADANDDGALDLSDPLFILLYLFQGGAAPPPPGPPPAPCGPDPSPAGSAGNLGCEAYEAC